MIDFILILFLATVFMFFWLVYQYNNGFLRNLRNFRQVRNALANNDFMFYTNYYKALSFAQQMSTPHDKLQKAPRVRVHALLAFTDEETVYMFHMNDAGEFADWSFTYGKFESDPHLLLEFKMRPGYGTSSDLRKHLENNMKPSDISYVDISESAELTHVIRVNDSFTSKLYQELMNEYFILYKMTI